MNCCGMSSQLPDKQAYTFDQSKLSIQTENQSDRSIRVKTTNQIAPFK